MDDDEDDRPVIDLVRRQPPEQVQVPPEQVQLDYQRWIRKRAFGYLLDARPAPDGARLSLRVSATKLGSVEKAEEVSRKLARMLSEGHSRLALRNALAAEYSSGQRRPGRASCAARPARQLLSATAQKLARWARKGIKKYPEIEQRVRSYPNAPHPYASFRHGQLRFQVTQQQCGSLENAKSLCQVCLWKLMMKPPQSVEEEAKAKKNLLRSRTDFSKKLLAERGAAPRPARPVKRRRPLRRAGNSRKTCPLCKKEVKQQKFEKHTGRCQRKVEQAKAQEPLPPPPPPPLHLHPDYQVPEYQQRRVLAVEDRGRSPLPRRRRLALERHEALQGHYFSAAELNSTFHRSLRVMVGGVATFWDRTGRLFLYYDRQEARWKGSSAEAGLSQVLQGLRPSGYVMDGSWSPCSAEPFILPVPYVGSELIFRPSDRVSFLNGSRGTVRSAGCDVIEIQTEGGSTMYTSEEDLERPKRLPRRGGAPPLPAAACGVLGVSHNAGFHQCRQRWMELVAQHGDSEEPSEFLKEVHASFEQVLIHFAKICA